MEEKKYDLFEQFARIEWLLRRYNEKNRKEFGPMNDPHRGQGRILAMLKLQPEISQKDLCYLLNIRPQSLGELLSKLERKGYITRTPSESDRRVMDIRLTEKGQKAADPQSDLDSLLDCLEDDEKENLHGYLDRIITAFESHLKEEDTEDTEATDFTWHRDDFEADHLNSDKEKASDDPKEGPEPSFDPRDYMRNKRFDPAAFVDDIRDTIGRSIDPKAFDGFLDQARKEFNNFSSVCESWVEDCKKQWDDVAKKEKEAEEPEDVEEAEEMPADDSEISEEPDNDASENNDDDPKDTL